MKKYLLLLIAFSFLAGASCQQKTDSDKEMKAILDATLEVWNTGNVSLFDEIFSPEVVLHHNDSEDLIGIEANKEWVTSSRGGAERQSVRQRRRQSSGPRGPLPLAGAGQGSPTSCSIGG